MFTVCELTLISGTAVGDLQKAQQVAATCRATCDMLKGAPKSSREDPQFMDNYYKSSRLHFIGTWKARIEALAVKSSGCNSIQVRGVPLRLSFLKFGWSSQTTS